MRSLRPGLLLVVFIIAAAGVCAPGCQRVKPAAGPVTLKIGIGIPTQGSQVSGARSLISQLRSEPWLTTRPDGHQSERIVSGWTWDESHTTLKLTLRKDVRFHDGTLLTPDIAADLLKQSAVANGVALSFSSIKSVQVSGPDSVDLHLSEPNQFVVPDLAITSVRRSDANGEDVATGPFQVQKQDDKSAVLTAFPQYYRGRPSIDRIEIATYPTQRNAWAALMRGEIDMLHEVSRDAADFVEAESAFNTYSFPRAYYIPLVFNVRNRALKNPEVRKAINEAIDRATLIQDGMSGRGREADGPIWPEHWAYAKPVDPFSFNPEAARVRLDRAGFPIRASSDGRMPSRFSFTCLFFGDGRFDRLAVLVQKQLADVGIDMKLRPVPQKELEGTLQAGQFDAFLFEMFGRSLSWVYEFWRSHPGAHFNNGYTAADLILDRIRGARTEDEVKVGMRELARVFHDDPPAAFIAWQTTSRAVSSKFEVEPEEGRDVLTNLWQWRLVNSRK
jgi:peptide/nickel transport system substrate-binding protein